MVNVANNITSLDITALLDDPIKQQLIIQGEVQGNGLPYTCSLAIGENFIEIEVYDTAAENSYTYHLTINRAEIDQPNADLWDIKTSAGVLTPAFDPQCLEYIVHVENIIKTLEITVTPADSSAIVSINEESPEPGTQTATINLTPGENQIPLTVTAGDENTIKIYTLKILRGPSNTAELADLRLILPHTFEELMLEPAFDPRIATYTVTEPGDINKVGIQATLADPGATLTIRGEEAASSGLAKNVSLDQGGNLLPLVVTASDGITQKAYILSINGKVSNADLADLHAQVIMNETGEAPLDLKLDFAPEKTIYELNVDNNVNRLIITASPDDPKALLMLNGKIIPVGEDCRFPLNEGDNSVELKVIAQDTSTKSYILNISRNAALTIETNRLPIGLLGVSYAFSFTAEGGSMPYQWSTAGLPAGFELDEATGQITGWPEITGTYELEITLTDQLGFSTTKKFALQLNLGYGNGGYLLKPLEDPAYTVGLATNGFPTMTVNQGFYGLRHFPVRVTPVKGHEGEETIIFVHLRNDSQIGINTAKTDFDLNPFAQAAFEVQQGDVLKVYMVDDLTSNPLLNPNIL